MTTDNGNGEVMGCEGRKCHAMADAEGCHGQKPALRFSTSTPSWPHLPPCSLQRVLSTSTDVRQPRPAVTAEPKPRSQLPQTHPYTTLIARPHLHPSASSANMWNPDAGKHGAVDLSTASASSSSGVLATVRAKRLAREQERRQELAALAIQRVWRGRSSARNTRAQLLEYLQDKPIGIEDTGKVLVLLSGDGDREGFGAIAAKWATSALEKDCELGRGC